MEDGSSQQRSPLLNMTVDELYQSIQRKKHRSGNWTMPGRLVVPEFSCLRIVNQVRVLCTRCKCEFTVWLPHFIESSPSYQTRPCPYCFKVGKIPDDLWAEFQ